MTEEWRAIDGLEYEVSDQGRVRRTTACREFPAGYILKQNVNRVGYASVHLWRNGQRFFRFVGNLVCECFHGSRPTEKHVAAHWDGVKLNNAKDNVRWATLSEIGLNKTRRGTHPDRRGSLHFNAKLNEEKVLSIREMRATGLSCASIGRALGVHFTTVYDVISGRSWAHI